ncbi:AAA family ATPase [Flavobacterium olei]|uniref:AAA family ATPase n=1 Tax=Flavobacterium olei TaxID=1886782 RepID=UPI003219FC92
MINFLHQSNKENLILFVHGFMGGKDTWRKEGVEKIPDFLIKNPKIAENFDLAEFQYYTQLSSKIEKTKYFWGLIPLPWIDKRKFTQNLSIDDITDILYSYLNINLRRYNKIVIVAHSMGGLISKATILKLIAEDKNKIELFLSLCVPHNGSKIADLGKLILSNPNVTDLAPLSAIIDQVNRGWIDGKTAENLPETIYFQGKNDLVVPNESSEGYDSRVVQTVYSFDDHSSILTPVDSESIALVAITDAILGTLKKKVNTEKRLINAQLSEESLELISEKIGKKIGANTLSISDRDLDLIDEPVTAAHCSSRKIFIKKVLSENTKPWLAIYGMRETGKSQLALLITKFLNIDSIWLNFKFDEQNIITKIYGTFAADNFETLKIKIDQIAEQGKKTIILDDLPKLGHSQSVDNFLNSFLSYCLSKGINLISTSNYKISSSITAVHTDNIAEIEIIPMTQEETIEVIETYPNAAEFNLKDLIHHITGGHPSYIQFVCRYLEDRNWLIKKEELLSFLSGNLFNDINEETQSKFTLSIEDGKSRDLMYRLNVIKNGISAKEIQIVAECSPEIERPIEKINKVIGTWIQKKLDTYTLSPLFKRLGVGNISQKLFRQISYNLGKSLMKKKNLSQYEFRDLIDYFVDAQRYDNAGYAVLTLLQQCNKNPDLYYDSKLHYKTWYFETLPEKMALILRLFIRTLQFNIAVMRKSEYSHAINFLRKDLIELVTEALENKIDVSLPALALSSSFLQEDSDTAMKYFTYYISASSYKNLPEKSISDINMISTYDNSMSWLLLMTIDNVHSLIEWFKNTTLLPGMLDESENEQPFLLSNSLFQNFIKHESAAKIPDWNKLSQQFATIYDLASTHNFEILKALSIRYQIRIQSEMLNDIEAAEKLFVDYISDFKNDLQIFLIYDELGRQFYFKNDIEKSKKYLDFAAQKEVEKFVTSKAESLHILALITAETEQRKAHAYMEELYEFIQQNIFISEIVLIQYIGEYATSIFTTGRPKEALIKFIEGYELLLDTFEESDDYYNLQLKFGNAIGYLQALIEKGTAPSADKFTTPYRTMFTADKDLKIYFFHEKLLLVSFIIVNFYELENNMSEAYRWAEKIFNLKEKVDLKIFGKMLTQLYGYYIIHGRYIETVEQQFEVDRLEKELKKTEVEKIQNKEEQIITSRIKQATENISTSTDPDFEFLIMVLNPILFHLLTRFLKNEINKQELYAIFNAVLLKCKHTFVNKPTLNYMQKIVHNLPVDNSGSMHLFDEISKIPEPTFGHLEILGLLITTMKMDPKNAIAIHFKISQCFPLYSGVVNNSILIPFYFEYWTKKIKEMPEQFNEVRRLESNITKANNLPIEHRLAAIFSLVSFSLGFKVPPNQGTWLSDYLEEYGES